VNKTKPAIEEIILETLSFYEAQTFAQIIMNTEMEKLKAHPNFTQDSLIQMLKKFEKKGLIKKQGEAWLRVLPKRSWWKKLTSWF